MAEPERPDASSQSPTPSYSTARAVGGLFFIILIGILSVIDAYSSEYSLDIAVLGLLTGSALVLLGVEAVGRRLLK